MIHNASELRGVMRLFMITLNDNIFNILRCPCKTYTRYDNYSSCIKVIHPTFTKFYFDVGHFKKTVNYTIPNLLSNILIKPFNFLIVYVTLPWRKAIYVCKNDEFLKILNRH